MNKNYSEGNFDNTKTIKSTNAAFINTKKLSLNSNLKSIVAQPKKYIPPMGPFIHPEFIKTYDVNESLEYDTLEDNYIDFYQYIY